MRFLKIFICIQFIRIRVYLSFAKIKFFPISRYFFSAHIGAKYIYNRQALTYLCVHGQTTRAAIEFARKTQ